MEKELTAERSIEIIRETIEKSRRDVERQAGTPLIVWGSLVAFTAVIIGHSWEHPLVHYDGHWLCNQPVYRPKTCHSSGIVCIESSTLDMAFILHYNHCNRCALLHCYVKSRHLPRALHTPNAHYNYSYDALQQHYGFGSGQ